MTRSVPPPWLSLGLRSDRLRWWFCMSARIGERVGVASLG